MFKTPNNVGMRKQYCTVMSVPLRTSSYFSSTCSITSVLVHWDFWRGKDFLSSLKSRSIHHQLEIWLSSSGYIPLFPPVHVFKDINDFKSKKRKKNSLPSFFIFYPDPFIIVIFSFIFLTPLNSWRQEGLLELLRGVWTLSSCTLSLRTSESTSCLTCLKGDTPCVCCFHKSKSTSVLKSATSQPVSAACSQGQLWHTVVPSNQVHRRFHLQSHSVFASRYVVGLHILENVTICWCVGGDLLHKTTKLYIEDDLWWAEAHIQIGKIEVGPFNSSNDYVSKTIFNCTDFQKKSSGNALYFRCTCKFGAWLVSTQKVSKAKGTELDWLFHQVRMLSIMVVRSSSLCLSCISIMFESQAAHLFRPLENLLNFCSEGPK